MNHGPYFIPQGAPPGTPLLIEEERPPEAVYYFRIYAVLLLLVWLIAFGMSVYALVDPLMKGVSSTTGSFVFALFMTAISFLFMIPSAIMVFAGRAKWVYTLGVVMLGLQTLMNPCCLPLTVPLLVYWMKPETKRWFGTN